MGTEVVKISPECLEIANSYLVNGDIDKVSAEIGVSKDVVVAQLNKKEVKRYIDNIYLDMGYRNRNRIGEVMDRMIDAKLEEAEESGMYSTKDLADLLQMAHKMRMDELKAQAAIEKEVNNQTNVQNNFIGEGNYGKLMEKLVNGGNT